MAPKNEVKKLKQRSRVAALEGLRSQRGFTVSPRKAMAQARKKSKGLPYPLPPYAGTNLLVLYQWARGEWQSLGRFKRLALPVVVLVALTTWEKENEMREARWDQIERDETNVYARQLYLKSSTKPKAPKKSLWPFKRKPKSKSTAALP